jgi:hypothetical protein
VCGQGVRKKKAERKMKTEEGGTHLLDLVMGVVVEVEVDRVAWQTGRHPAAQSRQESLSQDKRQERLCAPPLKSQVAHSRRETIGQYCQSRIVIHKNTFKSNH